MSSKFFQSVEIDELLGQGLFLCSTFA